jgi:HAUS augmin-like complex subunit 4
MVKALQGAAQNLPADVNQLIDQLERHCLAPDGSLVTKSVYSDLQLAREEMSRERLRYLEAMVTLLSLLPFLGFILISGFSSFTY